MTKLTPREAKSQTVLFVTPTTAIVECSTCWGVHKVGRDEDGGSIDQKPCECQDSDCSLMVCSKCRVDCPFCGLSRYKEHADAPCPCQEEEPEPDCECRRTDVDQYDASGCPLHDRYSQWNRRQRENSRKPEAVAAAVVEDGADCPF